MQRVIDPEAAKSAEIKLHEKLAPEYVKRRGSKGSQIFEAYWNEEVLNALAPYGRSSVVDCCCGDGVLLPTLLKRFDHVTGIDISEDMLALARRRVDTERCTIVKGDIENLPFEDESFDVAVFRGAFHHVTRPEVCLREIKRVLRPGGGVVFFEPNGDPILMRLFRRVYYSLSPKIGPAHRFYRRRELVALLEGAGLRFVGSRTIFFLAYPFAGLLDHFPLFGYVPFHTQITALLVRLDRVLSRAPVFKGLGLSLVVNAEKAIRQEATPS